MSLLKKLKKVKKRRFEFWVKILLVTGIFVGCCFLYAKDKNIHIFNTDHISLLKSKIFTYFDKNNGERVIDETIFETRQDIGFNSSFGTYKDYIVECNKDSINLMDRKGAVVCTFRASINNPLIISDGYYLLVADIGGKDIIVIMDKEVKWEKKLSYDIINASINKTGYISVIHGENRCRAAVTVFNPQGIVSFTTGKAENYIIASLVSPSGKYVLLNTVDTSGIKLLSMLEYRDMQGNLLGSSTANESCIFSGLWSIDGDSLCAVGDKKLIYFDKDRVVKWQKDIQGEIFSSGVSQSKYAIIAKSTEEKTDIFKSNGTDIIVYNARGSKVSSFQINSIIGSMEVYEDILALTSGREVYFTNLKGGRIGTYTCKTEVEAVRFLNKGEVLILSNNGVVLTKI